MSNMWQTFNQAFFLCVLTPAKASTRNVNISQSRTKPVLTARGHLTVPANHSTAQAKEETPLKIKTIKHLTWRIQMIQDLKERTKRNQFYRNSNRQMAGSHSRLSTEDIYWDTGKRWLAKRNCLALLLTKKDDRSSFFPRILPSLTCAEMGWHNTHTEYTDTAQAACISRLRSGASGPQRLPMSFKRAKAAPLHSGPSSLGSATQERANVCAPKLSYKEQWL